MEVKRIGIRSYNKVWQIENRIYAVQNIVLPVPINPREVLYFLLVASGVFVASKIIPFFSYLPTPIKYLVIPFALSQFLLKKKLDGKMPQKYFIAWIRYMFAKDEYTERFQINSAKKDNKINISWMCSRGYV